MAPFTLLTVVLSTGARSSEIPKNVLQLDEFVEALCPAIDGGVWVVLQRRIIRFDNKIRQQIAKPSNVKTLGCGEDGARRLWLPASEFGLFTVEGGRWRAWPKLNKSSGMPRDIVIDERGRAAIMFNSNYVAEPNQPFTAFKDARGGIGALEGFTVANGPLYLFGSKGVASSDAKGSALAKADDFPWLASINGLVRTPQGDVWIFGDAGLVQMKAADFDAAIAGRTSHFQRRIFDFHDGLTSFPQKGPGVRLTSGGDGRLWMITRQAVLVLDPGAITQNLVPPTIVVRSIATAGERFASPSNVELRAGTTSLSLEFAALSLAVPSRNVYRYRLFGHDKTWIKSGRRVVTYDNLTAGTYRFVVSGTNNDGVSAQTPAVVTFTIPPTLFQRWTVRFALLLAAGVLLWLAYSARLRQISQRYSELFRERLAERERIARELHDTLLQSVQGLILQIQSLADTLTLKDDAKASMEGAIDRAEQLLVEGRERVHDLRSSASRSLEYLLTEVADRQLAGTEIAYAIDCHGIVRPIHAEVSKGVVRIAEEALFNITRHANATKIELTVTYDNQNGLTITITDDGCGFDVDRARVSNSNNHFGIVGMLERAEELGGRIAITSDAGHGTKVLMHFPKSIAYVYGQEPLTNESRLGFVKFWSLIRKRLTTGGIPPLNIEPAPETPRRWNSKE